MIKIPYDSKRFKLEYLRLYLIQKESISKKKWEKLAFDKNWKIEDREYIRKKAQKERSEYYFKELTYQEQCTIPEI